MVAESTLPLGNGHTTTYSYDSRYRLSGIVTTNGTITPQDVGYSYDEAGNIIETNDHASSEDLWYKYDALNRLTEMRLGSPSGPLQAAYTYDPAPSLGGRLGNMTAKQEGATATPAAMTYNAEHVHAPSTYNGGPLVYDKNGNLTFSMWTETFLYNVENQRAQATNWWYNLVTNYLYDGDGNLVRRDSTLPGFAPSIRTDVEELYQEDSVGCATTPTTTTRFYRAFGRIIATRTTTSSTSDVRYYVADHLGSTNTILTASGSVYVGGMKYWPFGAQRTGSTPDHSYTGQLRDDYSTIGAYYYHARFYSPTLAQFTSADTSAADGLNRYAYVGSNLLNATDPSGRYLMMLCGWKQDCNNGNGGVSGAGAIEQWRALLPGYWLSGTAGVDFGSDLDHLNFVFDLFAAALGSRQVSPAELVQTFDAFAMDTSQEIKRRDVGGAATEVSAEAFYIRWTTGRDITYLAGFSFGGITAYEYLNQVAHGRLYGVTPRGVYFVGAPDVYSLPLGSRTFSTTADGAVDINQLFGGGVGVVARSAAISFEIDVPVYIPTPWFGLVRVGSLTVDLLSVVGQITGGAELRGDSGCHCVSPDDSSADGNDLFQ